MKKILSTATFTLLLAVNSFGGVIDQPAPTEPPPPAGGVIDQPASNSQTDSDESPTAEEILAAIIINLLS